MPREAAGNYLKSFKVSNVRSVPGGTQLRVLSALQPSAEAVLEDATLEDLFLSYFGEKAGDSHDEI